MVETGKAGIEDVRDYWNDRPCNIRHGTAEIGTREYFDQVEWRKYFVEYHIPGFAEFDKWKGKKVLDLGCGIGTHAIGFAKAGAKVTCVELSKTSLDLCKKRFEVYGLSGKFYLGSAEELDKVAPPQKFDLIYSFGVLHHTPNPEKAFALIKDYMTPESELRVMLYSKWSTKNIMIALGLAQPEAQAGCPVAYTYSFAEVRELMNEYDVFDIQKEHIFPYQIPEYVKYEYVKKPHWRFMPEPMFRVFERTMGWHTLIKARLPR